MGESEISGGGVKIVNDYWVKGESYDIYASVACFCSTLSLWKYLLDYDIVLTGEPTTINTYPTSCDSAICGVYRNSLPNQSVKFTLQGDGISEILLGEALTDSDGVARLTFTVTDYIYDAWRTAERIDEGSFQAKIEYLDGTKDTIDYERGIDIQDELTIISTPDPGTIIQASVGEELDFDVDVAGLTVEEEAGTIIEWYLYGFGQWELAKRVIGQTYSFLNFNLYEGTEQVACYILTPSDQVITRTWFINPIPGIEIIQASPDPSNIIYVSAGVENGPFSVTVSEEAIFNWYLDGVLYFSTTVAKIASAIFVTPETEGMRVLRVDAVAEGGTISQEWDLEVGTALEVSFTPAEEEFDIGYGEKIDLSVTANLPATFTWYVDTFEVQKTEGVAANTEVFYEYGAISSGAHFIECYVDSGLATTNVSWIANVPEQLSISTKPTASDISLIQFGDPQIFEATSNITADFDWVLDGVTVLQKTGTSVNYPFEPEDTGDFRLVLIAEAGGVTRTKSWDINVSEAPLVIDSVSPEESAVSVLVGGSVTFEASTNMQAVYAWYINGALEATTELKSSDSFFYEGLLAGTDTVKLEVVEGTKSDSFTWTVSVVPLLEIVSETPESGNVYLELNDTENFNVEVNKTAFIQWYVDGVPAISETGTSSSFPYKGENSGIYGIEARATIQGETPEEDEIDSFAWTVEVLPVAYLDSVNPSQSEITLNLNDSIDFSATATGLARFEWYVNDTLKKSDNLMNTSVFPFDAVSEGIEKIEVRVISGAETPNVDSFIWNVSIESILDFSFVTPLPLNVSMTVGIGQEFSVTTTGEANFSWTVDGIVVSTDTAALTSNYFFTPSEVKPYSLQVIASSGAATLASSLSVNSLQEPEEGTSIIPILAVAGFGAYLLAGRKKK